MNLEAYLVNAFTTEIGCGNPAGVVITENEISKENMQKIAFDINKSETAFVRKIPNGYGIQWFTPLKEVPLCGHATLAASKVLFENGIDSPILFSYGDGIIEANQEADNAISMLFPEDEYEMKEIEKEYYRFFGIDHIVECIYGKNTKKVILVIDNKIELSEIAPRYEIMKEYCGLCRNGIGITKKADVESEFDFESRYFNPWYGVNEDPVTGSLHTVLSRYWSDKLLCDDLIGYQKSFRPGIIRMKRVHGKVLLNGKARIFMKGSICI